MDYRRLRYALALVLFPYQYSLFLSRSLSPLRLYVYPFFYIRSPDATLIRYL